MDVENYSWAEGIERVIGLMRKPSSPWKGAEVRILARPVPAVERTHIAPLIINIQGVFEATDVTVLTTLVDEPLILEGSFALDDAISLLSIVQNGGSTFLAGVGFDCSTWGGARGAQTVSQWIGQGIEKPWMRLLQPVIVGGQRINPYGLAVEGNSSDNQFDVTNTLMARYEQYGFDSPEAFELENLGMIALPLSGPRIAITLPEPIWLTATIRDRNIVDAALWSRPPLSSTKFWVAASSTRWTAKIERHGWEGHRQVIDGWHVHSHAFPVASNVERFNVWAGRDDTPELTATVQRTPETLERQRYAVLQVLYQESGKRFSDEIAPTGRLHGSADYFEIGIGNLFASLGYAVINVGKPVSTRGVDLIAFDINRSTAIAMSVTTGNEIQRKLASLLSMKPKLDTVLSQWTRRYVIVTTATMPEIIPSAVKDCSETQVLLITGEDLSRVGDDDATAFSALLSDRWQTCL